MVHVPLRPQGIVNKYMGIKQFFRYVSLLGFILCTNSCFAQRVVALNDAVSQYIFSFQEIEYLEDPGETLTIDEVSSPEFSHRFTASPTFSPENYNRSSAYWYRIRVKHNPPSKHQWQIE